MSNTLFSHLDFGGQQEPAKPVLPTGPVRGDGEYVVPHVGTFSGLPNTSQKIYQTLYDEALLHSRENAWRMSLDPVIWSSLWLRWYPTSLLTWKLKPQNPDDPAEQAAATLHEKIIREFLNVPQIALWLLHAQWSGRSAVMMKYQWKYVDNAVRMVPTGAKHIHGDKLVFGWDETPGILVHSMMASNLPSERVRYTERGMAYFMSPEDRERLLIHSFMPEDADFYRVQNAGAIFGNGFRGRLYWFWALKQRIWALGVDFLEWFSQGLTAYYYEFGNAAHLQETLHWAEQAQGKKAFMYPRMKDGSPGFKPLERFEASTASPAFIQTLLTDYFDKMIRIAINGQTLSSDTAPTGLGSGVAAAHKGTEDNIVKFDATMLQPTWKRDLLRVLYNVNAPGIPVPDWVYEIDSPNVQAVMDTAKTLFEMGASLDEASLLEVGGLVAPKEGATILNKLQSMNPAATEGMPEGVPVVTSPSPEGEGSPDSGGQDILGQAGSLPTQIG